MCGKRSKKNKVSKTILKVGVALLLIILPLFSLQAETENNKSAGYLYAEGPQQQKMVLPLKKTQAHLEMTGGVIRAEVKQVFVNTSPYNLEAIYVFPLPAQATVTDLTLTFKDKIIRSLVKEKAEAQSIYEKAKTEGKKTVLLEEERPNIFTTSVANFAPGETVEVTLTYLEPATFLKGHYEIIFPTVVGPRYIPLSQIQTEGLQDAMRVSPPLIPEGMASDHQFDIHVAIDGIPYEKIHSPTHDLKIDTLGPESAEVSLTKTDVPNRDFVLKIFIKAEATPTLTSLQSKYKEEYYSLLQVYPPKLAASDLSLPREVIFLVDTSGSMMGESIDQAKTSLRACLNMLQPQDSFNLVRFSSDFSSFAPQSQIANPSHLAEALKYVDRLVADGGTEMQPALNYVLHTPPDPNKMRIIVFLTDGDVGDEKSLMQLVNKDLNNARIFPFGIGSAPNEFLLRKLGELGRGTTNFIHSGAEIDQTLTQFFSTLNSPILTNIETHWLDANGKEIYGIQSYPKHLPDIFADRPLQLVTRFSKPWDGRLMVDGMVQGRKVKFDYPLTKKLKDSPGIRTIFGRAWIDELLYDYNFPKSDTDLEGLKKKITDLALDFQIITPFTSRVAVEQKIIRKPTGEIVTVEVPTLLPEGWDRRGMESTATNEIAYFVAGLLLCIVGATLLFGKRHPFHQKRQAR